MAYQAKDDKVLARQLKVQRLVIPFSIVGNATPASVVQRSDEPAILFLRTEGVDDITVASGALDSGDVATYADAAVNSTGIFNILVRVNELVEKVCSARIYRRAATAATATAQAVALGSAAGVVQTAGANGSKIMLTGDSDVALNAANTLDACLEVEYIVKE